MQQSVLIETQPERVRFGWMQGVGLTLLLAMVARLFAKLPFLSIMGPLVLAILLGITWRATFGMPGSIASGVSFSSKHLLRLGIILLGVRLNFTEIVNAGPRVLVITAINITFTLVVVYWLCRALHVEKRVGLLAAVGTAICGAAAIVAVAPQIKAKEAETAVAVTIIALLGTFFTVLYTVLYPVLNLSPNAFGVFAGATLHEIAHVVAAASPFGSDSLDTAVIVKLTRVAMLIPVSLLLAVLAARAQYEQRNQHIAEHNGTEQMMTEQMMTEQYKAAGKSGICWGAIQFPWFILGFVVMSGINTMGVLPSSVSDMLLTLAYLLMAMAMGGMGLTVSLSSFRRLGGRAAVGTLIGSVLLSVLGYVLVRLWYTN